MPKEELKSFKQNLLACAQRLERFNRSYAGWLLGVQSGEQCLRDSPRLLRESAHVLQWFLVIAGPKKHPLTNFKKLWLVRMLGRGLGECTIKRCQSLVNPSSKLEAARQSTQSILTAMASTYGQ